MSTIPKANPFKFGYGNVPAHFAGRKDELKNTFSYLDEILGEKNEKGRLVNGTNTPILLIGPRGVGKTSLLVKTREQAEKLNIEHYTLLKKDFNSNFGAFVNILTKKNKSLFDVKLDEINFNLTELVNVKLRPNNADSILEQIFEINLMKHPMLLICDESHEYNVEDFGDFINLIQTLISKSYPIALIFAGTPELLTVIKKIDASFIYRSRFKFINRLNNEDSIEAIKVPFEKYDIKFADNVLKLIIESADYYPFFLQMIGKKLWEITHDNNLSIIDLDTAKKAIDDSSYDREVFYALCFEEIEKSSNFKLLINILEFVINNNNSVEMHDLFEYLRENYSKTEFVPAYDELIDLGIIWKPLTIITPGIPSFINFVLAKVGKLK